MTKFVLGKIITLQVKYTMNIQQAKQIFLKDFVSKALPDDYLGDDGTIPTNKFSTIRKSAVKKLMERLEKMLTEELRTMEDYEELLSCEEEEEVEEDTTKEEDTMDIQQAKEIFLNNYLVLDYYDDNHLIEHYGVAEEKLEAFKEYFQRCDGAMEEVMVDIVENFYRDSEEDALSEEEDSDEEEEDSDEEEEYICEICATAIDVDEDDWLNCHNCYTICCTDCYVYRPDIFGKKEMDEENDCGWNNCEVCTDCDKEFRKADDE